MKRLFVILSLIFIATSCVKDIKKPDYGERTLNKSEIGIYDNGSKTDVVVYSSELHQTALSSSRLSSRIQTDNQSMYVALQLAAAPVVGENVEATLKVRGLDIEEADGVEMEVLQIKEGKIWLLYDKLGIVMPW